VCMSATIFMKVLFHREGEKSTAARRGNLWTGAIGDKSDIALCNRKYLVLS
jgi:hypothetical protein